MCVTDLFMERSSTPTENSLRNEVSQQSKIPLTENRDAEVLPYATKSFTIPDDDDIDVCHCIMCIPPMPSI